MARLEAAVAALEARLAAHEAEAERLRRLESAATAALAELDRLLAPPEVRH